MQARMHMAALAAGLISVPVMAQLTDDFDDGVLDGWSDVVAYQDATTASAAIMFDGPDGQLVISATADDANGDLVSGAYLIYEVTGDTDAFVTGSAGVDVHASGIGDDTGLAVRLDPATQNAVIMGVHKAKVGGHLFVDLAINEVVVAGMDLPFEFDASNVRLEASWAGNTHVITATQLDGDGSATLTWVNPTETGGSGVALIADFSEDSGADITGVFDNFELFCGADCNRDSSLNILDFICFQDHFTQGDAAADCHRDGVLNILDFVCFQGVFLDGCP